MIIDSSVLVAILSKEPETLRLVCAIGESSVRWLPASCFFEASMLILGRSGEDGIRDLDQLIARYRIEIVSSSETQARLAHEAFKRYGKGRHPAKLNFSDCMAYELAKDSGEELLLKGTDFAQTDIAVALY